MSNYYYYFYSFAWRNPINPTLPHASKKTSKQIHSIFYLPHTRGNRLISETQKIFATYCKGKFIRTKINANSLQSQYYKWSHFIKNKGM